MIAPPFMLGVFLLGGVMIVMGGCLYVITDYRRLRRHVLDRFARRASTQPSAEVRPQPLRLGDVSGAQAKARPGLGLTALHRVWQDHPRLIVIGGLGLTIGILTLGIGFLGIGPWWSLLACVAVLCVAGAMLPRWHRAKVKAQIEAALPDALDIAVRSLRIGIPISMVIRALADDTPGVLSAEFAFTANQIEFGKDTVSALNELADRCDSQTLRFLAAAVAIQSETGGNLAGLVEKLSALARARIRLRRKIDSITAEAKWSGIFLSIFPILASLAMWMIAPDYFLPIKEHGLVMPVLAAAGVMLALNILFMRRIVRFE